MGVNPRKPPHNRFGPTRGLCPRKPPTADLDQLSFKKPPLEKVEPKILFPTGAKPP